MSEVEPPRDDPLKEEKPFDESIKLLEELFKVPTVESHVVRGTRPDELDNYRYTRRPAGYPSVYTVLPKYDIAQIQEIPLWPSGHTRRRRLNAQADEVRARLEDPRSVMLVVRGTTYSATSIWGIVKLFLFVKLFRKKARKKYPTLK